MNSNLGKAENNIFEIDLMVYKPFFKEDFYANVCDPMYYQGLGVSPSVPT